MSKDLVPRGVRQDERKAKEPREEEEEEQEEEANNKAFSLIKISWLTKRAI